MNTWRKGIASWRIGPTLYLSVPFTWLLPEATAMAKAHKGSVMAGGPAVDLMPGVLAGVAEMGGPSPVPPLSMHNPLATFTTRGCPNACSFCAVPRIEGSFRELEAWPVRPMICDNNLLASSQAHFDRVIDRLKTLPYVDFNQGLDARLLTPHHARRLAELQDAKVRFAFDHISLDSKVADAISMCRQHGLKNFGIYVLIGFRDTPEDAHHRLETVRSWGLWPNPMRYQPLDSLEKNSYIAQGWSERELRRTMKYYSRLRWLEHVPYEDFRPEDLPLFPAEVLA